MMGGIRSLAPCLAMMLALAACQQSTPQQPVAQSGGGSGVIEPDAPLAAASPVDLDPNNPLIGQWSLDGGLACNYDHLTFTEDMRVIHRTSDGERAARDIPTPIDTYKVERGKVTVEVVGEDEPTSYVVYDPNHIGDGTDNCRLHRQM